MVKQFFIVLALFFMYSCNPKLAVSEVPKASEAMVLTPAEQENPEQIPYFKANGNEPFWNFTISETGIQFTSLMENFENFTTPHADPISAMDANIKLYKIETESVNLTIQISQKECINTMSGEASPYSVSIELKNSGETEFQKLEGCGSYITDYRLHDIWVLESLQEAKVSLSDFSKELPYLEINTTTNTFSGHAGCNRINGRLFYEKGLLRFTNPATTKMMCMAENKEDLFLKALQSSSTYKIEKNRLHLSNPSGLLLVFKKID